jgi:hypothetical protein
MINSEPGFRHPQVAKFTTPGTATRIDKTKHGTMALSVSDSIGNVTACDPVF